MAKRTVSLAAVAFAALAGPLAAEELRLGIATETTSIDPNFYNFPQNHATAHHWSEPLVMLDNKQAATPSLAESWRTLPGDEKTWEFKLRRGVKFSDGAPFTADDVLFTREYALTVNTSSPTGRYWANKTFTKIDDYTLQVTTGTMYPLMVKEVGMVNVVSRKHGAGKNSEDYNSGKAAIGTGPYKFVEWVKGERVVFERNPGYWGEKQPWERVTFRIISSDAPRVAALLSGGVDIIDNVPTTDLAQLRKDSKIAVTELASNRVIYMVPDMFREISPFVKTNEGQPAKPNPLLDLRVRKAISLAIDRKAIVERVMEGAAEPAGQMSPEFIYGHNPKLKPDPHDPEAARKLLTEAGYPNGFRLTIHGPNDRYINDEKVLQAIAQMLTRVGIKTEVVAIPKASYFTRIARGGEGNVPEFSLAMTGSGSNIGDGGSQIQNSHHTVGKLPNMGVLNYSRYSNPVVDDLLVTSSQTVDEKARLQLVQQANEMIMADVSMIPLHYQKNSWAHRRDLGYAGHVDEMTKAMLVTKKK